MDLSSIDINQKQKTLESTLKSEPDNLEAIKDLAKIFLRQEKFKEALKLYQKAIDLDSQTTEFYMAKGEIYYRKGELDKALWEYEIARRLEPNYSAIYNNLAIIYAEKGFIDGAISLLKTALQINPKDSSLYTNLGILYSLQGFKDRAMNLFKEAIKFDPSYVRAHYFWGIECENKGKISLEPVLKIGAAINVFPFYQVHSSFFTWNYKSRVEDSNSEDALIAAPIVKGVVIP